jgi:two-component system, chemotaxis family, response regulator Rcp1
MTVPVDSRRAPVPRVGILLVEDSPSDVAMTVEVLREGLAVTDVTVADDGEMAMAILRREGSYRSASRPDLIILDLNLPRMGGHEVLAAVKNDDALKAIPIVVLTSSGAESDVVAAYELHANAYLKKSIGFDGLRNSLRSFEAFWLMSARLPTIPERPA